MKEEKKDVCAYDGESEMTKNGRCMKCGLTRENAAKHAAKWGKAHSVDDCAHCRNMSRFFKSLIP